MMALTKILNVTRDLVVDQGYAGVTMQKLEDETGYSQTKIYALFGGKFEIFKMLIRSEMDNMYATMLLDSKLATYDRCLHFIISFRHAHLRCNKVILDFFDHFQRKEKKGLSLFRGIFEIEGDLFRKTFRNMRPGDKEVRVSDSELEYAFVRLFFKLSSSGHDVQSVMQQVELPKTWNV